MAATVLSMGDGDTLRVRKGRHLLTIRLACIDAPEMAQGPHGARARELLQGLAPVGAEVSLQVQTTFRYGRSMAEVFRRNENVNRSLVLQGGAQSVAFEQLVFLPPTGRTFQHQRLGWFEVLRSSESMKKIMGLWVLLAGTLSLCKPVLADGVCTPSGWCRLHFRISGSPYPTEIYPVDAYGRYRRFFVRSGNRLDRNIIDCAAGVMSINNGPLFSVRSGMLTNEMYQSICLKQNILVFPQAPQGGFRGWPTPPPPPSYY